MGKEERFNYYINKKDDRDWFIDDRVNEEEITTFKGVVEVLNQQAERIAELEEQLKNAIVPKFKVGQTVYTFNKNTERVYELYIKIIRIERNEIVNFNSLVYLAERLEDTLFYGYFEEELFATKEEAQAKLKELQGEKK